MAVFHAFSKAISEAKRKYVVIDTAPTGHTLLLLDTAGSYHREIMRNANIEESHIRTPFMALQDEKLTKILLVSLLLLKKLKIHWQKKTYGIQYIAEKNLLPALLSTWPVTLS